METIAKALKGGEFLIKETPFSEVFIPEEFNEEQMMMANAAHELLEKEVYPNLNSIDAQEEGLMPHIMDKAGELGLLGVGIPEEYGEFNEEQMMMANAAHELLEKEVYPNLNRIDAQEEGLMPHIMDKAGELGLLGVGIPEEY